jgi:hypothetical protein
MRIMVRKVKNAPLYIYIYTYTHIYIECSKTGLNNTAQKGKISSKYGYIS